MVLQGCASETEQVNTDTVYCKLAMDLPKGTVENINKAFGCEGKQIHVIIVSRSQTKTVDGTTRISYPAMQEGQINNVIKQLEGKLKVLLQGESNNELKIVVFNEAFFGKDKPLTFDEKDKILKKLREMNSELGQGEEGSANTLIVANVLYTATKSDWESQGEVEDQSMKEEGWDAMIDRQIQNILKNAEYFIVQENNQEYSPVKEGWQYYKGQIKTILFNRSFFLYNGRQIAVYDKRTYLSEADKMILKSSFKNNPEAIYCFGDGKIKKIGEGIIGTKASDVTIDQIVSAEICKDVEAGVRGTVEQSSANDSQNIKFLHIIQSNALPYVDHEKLPQERLTIVADSEGSSGVYYKSAKHVQKFIVSHDTLTDNVIGIFFGTIMENDR